MSSPVFIVPEWPAPARVRAVMTTREGGVSRAPWHSLNLGTHVGDDPAAVLENRARVRRAASLPSDPVWLEQVHGVEVIDLDASVRPGEPSPEGEERARPRADAAVTTRPGVVCAIQVADCMPVLFAARDGLVIGAAHAGWRGLAGGVLENTIEAMHRPASEIIAWLGPAIGPEQFEVGDDVVDAFTRTAREPDLTRTRAAFQPKESGKWLCDLTALARLRLNAAGVTEVSGGGECTVSDTARFFSYRRDGQTGRMAALIWLAPGAAERAC